MIGVEKLKLAFNNGSSSSKSQLTPKCILPAATVITDGTFLLQRFSVEFTAEGPYAPSACLDGARKKSVQPPLPPSMETTL